MVDDEGGESRDGDVCEGQQWWALEQVQPAQAVDYLELRALSGGSLDTLDDIGEPCATATDVGACTAALDALSGESEMSIDRGQASLALTRGDSVELLRSFSQVQGFLGEIDRAGDAALWMRLNGQSVVCEPGDDVETTPEGYVLQVDTPSCFGQIVRETYLVRPDAEIVFLRAEDGAFDETNCGTGRVPDGLCSRRRSQARGPVGRFLAEVAELEAASVPAFEQLARELHAHGAPLGFSTAALSARADEIRHAATTRRLAERYGARVRPPRVRNVPLKDRVAMAADNAAEGCVRETFGALLAHAQSHRAKDPAVRRAMRTIARDESRHAALSWQIATWARAQMTPSERRRVASSASQSIERLRDELTAPVDAAVEAAVGMPQPDVAKSMFGRLHSSLLRSLQVA